MFRLAIRCGQLQEIPAFLDRLTENPPREGFFEHSEVDFAYYSGWRRREITELTWAEIDIDGGVVRLDPRRSKTRMGRVLPISAPLASLTDPWCFTAMG